MLSFQVLNSFHTFRNSFVSRQSFPEISTTPQKENGSQCLLTGSPAPITWCGQSWYNAAGQIRRTCFTLCRVVCITHEYNKRHLYKYENVRPGCSHVQTQGTTSHTLYSRTVWTDFLHSQAHRQLTLQSKRQLLHFYTQYTNVSDVAADRLHDTSNCS